MSSSRFNKIFEAYYRSVHRRAVYILGSAEAAEDVAQETFLRLYRTPPQEQNNIAGWLMRVAANLAYNHLRGENNRARRESAKFLEEPVAASSPSVEEMFLQSEEARMVHSVLQRLPPRDRVCLLLKHSGAGYREIADALSIKPGSVGVILARARAGFKKEYERLQRRN
ncbi:MAG: sigma-70 family RNA polymerase sigma factor [Peptococcaceae bacterium]|nr:MAG: sigma-70 family RNA polymerase sigma factor [Peptococcaceae bacterium]